MRLEAINLQNFPPFKNTTIRFPSKHRDQKHLGEIHLITGANGTGKTRLLCLIAGFLGNPDEMSTRLGTTQIEVRGVWRDRKDRLFATSWGQENQPVCSGPLGVTGIDDALLKPRNELETPHHAPDILTAFKIQRLGSLAALAFRGSVVASDAQISAMSPVNFGKPNEHLSFAKGKNEDALVCQAMANLKMSAAMDQMRGLEEQNSRAMRIVNQLERALTQVTGREFAFDVTNHPNLRLRLFWGGSEMAINQAPDGLRATIGWLVSCIAKLDAQFPTLENPLDQHSIVLLDEPETHLHPAWGRHLLPAAQALLPNSQIFVVTHSPFMISSVNDGWIHILRSDDAGLVEPERPIPCSKGDSYLDAVEHVLGLEEWYDPETEELLSSFRSAKGLVLEGRGDLDALKEKAATIGERSESLSELMGRELSQIERLLTQKNETDAEAGTP